VRRVEGLAGAVTRRVLLSVERRAIALERETTMRRVAHCPAVIVRRRATRILAFFVR
jgi:hypothetical protein